VSELARAALGSWSFEPLPVALIALAAIVYGRGFASLRRQMPERFPPWRLAAFAGGLAAIAIALFSPLDSLAGLLLSAHMLQHLLLTMVAPPLLWLGAPAIPLLRGLPVAVAKDGLGPFLASPGLRRALHRATHPVVCLVVFVATMWVWHVPSLYELALASRGWHEVEHACFLSAALLFWWPVVQPWPSVAHWPRWTTIPYLALADLQNTAFSALFAFSDRVFYPSYAAAPQAFGISPLDDQVLAGAIMWVPGQIAFLAPVAVILTGLLSPERRGAKRVVAPAPEAASLVRSPRDVPFDLLRAPVVGAALRRAGTRRLAQGLLLLLAIAVVLDGFRGPAMSPMNAAGVLPWTYYRGFAVVALLAIGNLFCFACPFMLPRELAKRVLPASRRWPRALRSKWLAAALLAVWFAAYEALDLWDSPLWTAWIVVGYFAAAFAIDGLFRGAAFCKWVCPIGQFHFVTSLVSPLEVRARDTATCASCTTHDCLRGNQVSRGCETELFVPRKAGNLDCTFCLDCARACPHDNVGLLAVAPASGVVRDVRRSSFGRLSRRPDVAALALVLVFAAFANAAGMIAPAAIAESGVSRALGVATPVATALLLVAAIVALPAFCAVACGTVGRRLAGATSSLREIATRFALALVPLGAGMWAAHLIFHLGTAASSAVPVAQRAAIEAGWSFLGAPDWGSAHTMAAADWLVPAKLLLLDAGLCLTIVAGWRIATQLGGRLRPALALFGPWAGLATALWIAGVWILLQPMEMRGTMVH
jgi:cytochrome c oxidase assembly factor CtaG